MGAGSSANAWHPEDSLSGRPSGPLPPPPKPPDFGSLAPRLGRVSAETSDWGDDEDAAGDLGDAAERRLGGSSGVGLSAAQIEAPRRTGSLAWFAIAAVVLLSGVGLFFLWPRSGRLIVNVSGPGGVEVRDLQILVDGELACQTSPCTIAQLEADTHRLRILAPGYQQPGERMVVVPSGGDATVDVSLVPGEASAAAAKGESGTGLSVPELGKYLKVKIDGVERGDVPIRLADLAPGEHEIEISGSDRYAPFKEKLTLEEGKVLEYRPRLTVTKGLARVEAGQNAAGARVTLDCPNEGESLLELPTSVDVAASADCVLRASKEGFAILEQPVTFAEGDAEKTFRIDLEPAPASPVVAGRGAPRTAAKGGSQCRISVNSIPSSNAVVGGRPVGKTPASVGVACGRQVVMFIHPQKGRKSVTVQAIPGKVAVAAVRF